MKNKAKSKPTTFFTILLILVLFYTAYKATKLHGHHPYPPLISNQHQIKITDYGPKDPEERKKFKCEDFQPSVREIREFFQRAKYPIEDTHYQYSWGNCYVKGTATLGKEIIQWELQDSVLAIINFPHTPTLLAGTKTMPYPFFVPLWKVWWNEIKFYF